MPTLNREMFSPSRMTQEDVNAFVRRYRNDPIRFAEEVLLTKPDANQRRILESVAANNYTAVSSGRGIGKTIVCAIVGGWVLSTRAGAKVMMLSNTDQQSRMMLWPPLVKMLKESLVGDWFDYSTELVCFKGEPEQAFIKRATWSENSIESVSGLHSVNMIYICDEASRLPNNLLGSLYASCTQSWNKMLLTSNPTRTTGYFYECFDPASGWEALSIDSRSSDWTDKGKIAELVERHGEESDVVRVQVRGMFPLTSSSSVVSEADIVRSMRATPRAPRDTDAVAMGIDIGGGGDPTCWAIRRGDRLVEIVKEQTVSDELILRRTAELVTKHNVQWVGIDQTGIGHFLPPRVRAMLNPMVEVRGINFGESSPEPDCYNTRSWLYRRVRDWMQAGGIIGNRPEIREQLLSTEYVTDDKGRMKLLSKEIVKEAIGHSPDESDALAISCGYMGNLMDSLVSKRTNGSELSKMLQSAAGWC